MRFFYSKHFPGYYRNSMHPKAEYYFSQLELKPHPEGGYFKEIYRSDEFIEHIALPVRYNGRRSFSTSIFFLLEGKDFSAFHRLKSDEQWHFYDGTSIKIYILDKHSGYNQIILGNDINAGEQLTVVIKRGIWFAAELMDKNSFALVGCSVAPGFEFDDFEIASRQKLVEEFPAHKKLIEQLSR